jgi:L-amino acid N-acyltransferase
MVAAVSSANPGAVAFHERLGFGQVGRMPEVGFKNGQYLDLILLQKMLNTA